MDSFSLLDLFLSFLGMLPALLAYIVGFAIALTQVRQHARAAVLAAVAFGVLFFADVAQVVLGHFIPPLPAGEDLAGLMIGLVCNLIRAAAVVLILLAVFHRRAVSLPRRLDSGVEQPPLVLERGRPEQGPHDPTRVRPG